MASSQQAQSVSSWRFGPSDIEWEQDYGETPGVNTRRMLVAAREAGVENKMGCRDFALRYIRGAGPGVVDVLWPKVMDEEDDSEDDEDEVVSMAAFM